LSEVTSPGHKLGQMIGNFLESIFSEKLVEFAKEHGFYCDKRGLRPAVRGSNKKVTWRDNRGNNHDLDYVFERNGTEKAKGIPVAFIELAWRRYTKHSRNKAGEIEGALVHLGVTYSETCSFLGAIICGEFTEGAIKQLESHRINVIYIPYDRVVEAFQCKGINLDYLENAPNEEKLELVHAIDSLTEDDQKEIRNVFIASIQENYGRFMGLLEKALLRKVETVRVLGLFGSDVLFASIAEAIKGLEAYDMTLSPESKFQKFEINVRFSNGDRIDGSFGDREEAMNFLRIFL